MTKRHTTGLVALSALAVACGSEIRDDNAPPPNGVNQATVQLLVDGLDDPYGIAVDAMHVFVSTHRGQLDGDVVQLPLAGGDATVLTQDQGGAYIHTVDLGHVYWSTWNDGAVRRIASDGGAVEDVIAVEPEVTTGLWVDDGMAFVTVLAPGDVYAASTDGAAIEHIASEQAKPGGIAKSNDTLYWFNTCSGGIMTMLAGGGLTTLLAPTTEAPAGAVVAAHEGYIYWVDSASTGMGSIQRVPAALGPSEVVATDDGWPASVIVDESGVYWASWAKGTIQWASHDGSEQRVLVSGLTAGGGGAVTLATDATHIYFTNRDAGQVLRTKKP